MKKSPSWEANRFTASQEIPRILWNPKVHHHVYNSLSLSWTRSIQSMPAHPTSWKYILILSSHLRVRLPSGPFPLGFPIKTSSTPYVLHAQPISKCAVDKKVNYTLLGLTYKPTDPCTTKESFPVLGNWTVHNRVHSYMPLVNVLNHLSPFQILTAYFLRNHFNWIIAHTSR